MFAFFPGGDLPPYVGGPCYFLHSPPRLRSIAARVSSSFLFPAVDIEDVYTGAFSGLV